MPSMPDLAFDSRTIQSQLHKSIIECSERCLYQSAKWAAELHFAISESISSHGDESHAEMDVETDNTLSDENELKLQRSETPRYLMAKSFFDCREFDRCASTLLPSLLPAQPTDRSSIVNGNAVSSKSKGKATDEGMRDHQVAPMHASTSRRSLFLALYAKFLAGEKRKEEDSEMVLGPADGPITSNRELAKILNILSRYFDARGGLDSTSQSDGFLEYLYGIVLVKSKSDSYAQKWLLKSVSVNRWNWGAWQELASCIDSMDQLTEISNQLQNDLMSMIFQIYSNQELCQTDDRLQSSLQDLDKTFPDSAFLHTQRALLLYHAKDFESAAQIFSSVMQKHPYRLDSLDKYSNMLFVMGDQRPQLAYLASVASATDKFRPETCCIIGNYYSFIDEHEEAVMYFRRALTLDRTFVSAWILMGHAYLELRKVRAAIESYRRAVDSNKKDYRAWYGLGQAYESLDMQSYALHYYQRAAALQPRDPKLWMAVGAAFKQCGKVQNAIGAYKRALGATMPGSDLDQGGDLRSFVPQSQIGGMQDPMAGAIGGVYNEEILYILAELYEADGDQEEAMAYMELCLLQEEGYDQDDIPLGVPPDSVPTGVGVTQRTSKARLWLARYSFAKQDWQRATDLANELCQDGYEVEEAKALKRDVRSRIEAQEHAQEQ